MNINKLLPIIGIIILVYILLTLDLHAIYVNFSNINPILSILSFLAIIPILLMTNIEWQIILKKHRINISNTYSLKNILIGYFYGFITPGGLGAYTRTLYLHDESNEPLEKCVSNVIILNAIDTISLLLIGVFGAFLLISQFPYLFFIIIIVLTIWICLFLLFLRKKTLTNIFKWIIKSITFSYLFN